MKDFESRVTEFLDKHFREIQYFAYGIGIVGFYTILRSVRILSRFEHCNQIPSEYISKGIKILGKIRPIELYESSRNLAWKPSVVLHIEHIPVLSLRTTKCIKPLQVSIAGVQGEHLVADKLVPYYDATVWIKLYGADVDRDLLYASVHTTMGWKFWKERDLAKILLKSQEISVSEYPKAVEMNTEFPAYYRSLLQYEAKIKYTQPGAIKRILTKIYEYLRRKRH